MDNLCNGQKDGMMGAKVECFMNYVNCQLCPRKCYVNREAGETGYCRAPAGAMVAKTMIHKWEEPALAGNGGSGAIFFGGCTLGCKYCQNRDISRRPVGIRWILPVCGP